MGVMAERESADRKRLSVPWIDCQGHLDLAESLRSRTIGAEGHAKDILARHDVELVLVMVWRFQECVHLLLGVELQLHDIADPRGDTSVRFVRDAGEIEFTVQFAFSLLEFDGGGNDVHSEVDLRDIERRIKRSEERRV